MAYNETVINVDGVQFSRRDLFAAMALRAVPPDSNLTGAHVIAHNAIDVADALIARLDETNPEKEKDGQP